MRMNNRAVAIIIAVCLVLSFSGGYFLRKHIETPVSESIQRDTVYLEKQVDFPVPAEPAEIMPAEPVIAPSSAVTPATDSTVAIEAETRIYRDTLNGISYEATVTGVQPVLTGLTFSYPETNINTVRTVVKPYEGWKLSVTSEAALALMQPTVQSLTAAEVSYNTGPFHFGLQGGLLVTKPFREKATLQPYLGGRVTIDILKFK